MNELEEFIVELNLIEKETKLNGSEKAEKLAHFLFAAESSGWKIIKSLYEHKIEVNSIFGEKLNDLLVSNCTKLLLNLPYTSKFHLKPPTTLQPNDPFDPNVCLIDASNSSEGNLFTYFLICLTLWLRFNDGLHNAHHLFTPNKVLQQLAEAIFTTKSTTNTSQTTTNEFCAIRSVYFKFLSSLFRLNFKNMTLSSSSSRRLAHHQKETSNSGAKAKIGHVFVEQFWRIYGHYTTTTTTTTLACDEKECLFEIVVNYLSDYFGYASVNVSMAPSLGALSASSGALNGASFENFVYLLNETSGFLFEEIVSLGAERFQMVCHKLAPILIEMKQFKNRYFRG